MSNNHMSVQALEGTLERIAVGDMTWKTLTPLVLHRRRLAREDEDYPDEIFADD